MIIALLIGVGGTAVSGMALYAGEEGKGPLAGWIAPASGASGARRPVTRRRTKSAKWPRWRPACG